MLAYDFRIGFQVGMLNASEAVEFIQLDVFGLDLVHDRLIGSLGLNGGALHTWGTAR
jgi:hypothetical protein